MSSLDRPYDEKRDFIRMRINSDVTITHNDNTYNATCNDLSGAGMLISCDQTFEIGDLLSVRIQPSSDNHLPFSASTKVSRVEQGTDNKQIFGLSILEIHE